MLAYPCAKVLIIKKIYSSRGELLSKESTFFNNVLKGNVFKEIVKLLLQKSGYTVYQYGYESTFSPVKSKLTRNTKNSRTVRRIRSSPDLLIYDDQMDEFDTVRLAYDSSRPVIPLPLQGHVSEALARTYKLQQKLD